jgi:hypothetical protein
MSAAGYTNRIRTQSEARVTKVQYPFSDAINYNPLYSSIGCNPQYSRLSYQTKQKCSVVVCPSSSAVIIYYGDGASLIYPDSLNGQHVADPPTLIFNGGNSS